MKLARCHKTEMKPETLLFQCFLNVLGTSGTAVILTPRQEYNLAPVPIPIEADTKYANTNGAVQPKLSCQLLLGRNWSSGMGRETRVVPLSWSKLSNLGKKRQEWGKAAGTVSGAPLRKRLLLFFFKLLPYWLLNVTTHKPEWMPTGRGFFAPPLKWDL